ncbi:MAG: ATP-binding cassette domain-containing protein [Micrococcales bacterium]|nr:ATP-binding cassette domain-containing protein [Micrococcales bacterium]
MTHRSEQQEPRPGAVLELRGIHAGYPGHPDVLDCAAMAVVPGARIAVMGPNGAGKTTLLRCLSGALRPARGAVLVEGEPLGYRPKSLVRHRELVQLVLQDPDDQLFSADVRGDISFGPLNLGLSDREAATRVDEALDLLDITDLADRPVHRLSYGQRKRVAIAGAVAMHPRVLLLDEPTAGLDPAAVTGLLGALARLEERGTTVVMSTHNVDLAWSWADEVALVEHHQVTQAPMVKILTDGPLLSAASLGLPTIVQLAGALGVTIDASAPPRTPGDLAAYLR